MGALRRARGKDSERVKLKAVHYINQFFAGFGGETAAGMGFGVVDGIKGPALGLNRLWNGEMEVAKVVYCGDNYVNEDANWETVKAGVRAVVEAEKPDVFIAGPAFNAGRYGVACAKVTDFVRAELGVPAVTGMWWENPAVPMYVKDNYIISTTETAVGMSRSLPKVAALALKLAKREPIGPARAEGYLPTGHRRNECSERTGAERTVQMLVDKLQGKPFVTEVPLRGFEKVPPAPPVKDITKTVIGLFTTGGLVPMGNPDKIKQAFAVSFGIYDIRGLAALKKGVYESIHGGYDTTAASNDPHRLVPLDVMRDLAAEGRIGGVADFFGATCGVGTNVETSKKMGQDLAQRYLAAGVQAAILTST